MVLVYLLELVAKSLSLLRSAKIAEKNGRFHGALCHISPWSRASTRSYIPRRALTASMSVKIKQKITPEE